MSGKGEKVVLVGGGGREHAIARSLAGDVELFNVAKNRNPGIERLARGYEPLDPTNTEAVIAFAESVDASMAVVGPEAPLEAGIVDACSARGIFAFGPTAANARIETDKGFQRHFMREHDIPGCPAFSVLEDVEAACAAIDQADHDLAVKPAGLTGGKGVKVIGDQVSKAEAKSYLRAEQPERIVLEERLLGEEFTVQAIVANGAVRTTPAVQDHKRAFAGDEGPNTGGMGSYSDTGSLLPFMEKDDYRTATQILESTVEALDDFTGILYGQFMCTESGVSVIEFNARFGDPEAMNTLSVLETPFVNILRAAREGRSLPELSFAPLATVCKYAVPTGYPSDPHAGTPVSIPSDLPDGADLFFASVDARKDGIYTTTSRSLAVVGVGDSIERAEAKVSSAFSRIGETGLHIRHDIGTAELVAERVEHMHQLRGGT